jgi:hypothetical protein
MTSVPYRCLHWLSCPAVFALFVFHAPSAFAIEWHIEVVDTTGNVGQFSSLAVDPDGFPCISYYDDTNSHLRYASKDATGWHTQTVDADDDVGYYTSLVLDSTGRAHISYCKYDWILWDPPYMVKGPKGLKYAFFDGLVWQIEEISTLGGGHSSLELNAQGVPHIADNIYVADVYHNVYPYALRYSFSDGSSWYSESVDAGRNVGSSASLGLNSSGCPHIAYFSCADGLRYAQCPTNEWIIETIEDSSGYISLALDEQGYARLAHHEDYCLKYAYQDGLGWHSETVDVGGQHTSLALDSDMFPHISYLGGSFLRYAYQDESGWHYDTVDPDGGSHTSLALGSDNRPHISYYCYSDLRYSYPTILLSATVELGELILTWSDFLWASAFHVYGEDNQPYFCPAPENLLAVLPSNTSSWSSSNGIGDQDSNWTYAVLAVDDGDQEITRSNYCGEHDFGMDIP